MSNRKEHFEILEIIFKLIVVSLLVIIAWTDWKTKHIPDKYILGILMTGIVSIWLMPEIPVLQRMTGIFAVSVPLLVLACVVRGSIGGGDIKLMAAAGSLLGAAGIWRAFEIGVLSAGGYVLWLLIRKRRERKSEIALGPFLCMGILFVLF